MPLIPTIGQAQEVMDDGDILDGSHLGIWYGSVIEFQVTTFTGIKNYIIRTTVIAPMRHSVYVEVYRGRVFEVKG